MTSTPAVSIIIPVYNVGKYLCQCLDSVLAQTFTDWECILVNDGSSDDSGAICDEYSRKDPRLRVIHQPNRGVSAARNKALKEAKGEWVAYVDSDDSITPNYLQTFIDIQKEHDADMVITGVDMIAQNVTRKHLTDKVYGEGEIYEFVIYARHWGVLGIPWNKFYSGRLIREHHILFDESLWSYEDEVFVVNYLKYAKKVVVSSAVTYNRFIREENSLSQKYIPLELHYKVADILYQSGMQLSNEETYTEHLNASYACHLSESVDRLYWVHDHFTRKERLQIINSLIAKAKEKKVDKYFYKQLRHSYRIYAHGAHAIELNALFNKYRRAIKSYIKACLPPTLVDNIHLSKATRK